METTKQETALAINLKRIMAEQDMKAHDLLLKSGVPLSRIGDILRSKTLNPQVKTVEKLAKALNVTMDELMAEEYEQKAG